VVKSPVGKTAYIGTVQQQQYQRDKQTPVKLATSSRKTPSRRCTPKAPGFQPDMKRKTVSSPTPEVKQEREVKQEMKRQKVDTKKQKKPKTVLRRASTLKAMLRNSVLSKSLRPQSRLICA
jgi:hypothetical protein